MDIRWSKDEERQINMYNGHYVIATLSFLGNKATENELFKHIVSTTGQADNLAEQELRRILNNAFIHGFLMKIGNEYLLPTPQNEIDGKTKGKRAKKAPKSKIKKEPEESEEHECSDAKIFIKEEVKEEYEEKSEETLRNDYINSIEEMMKLNCILFRNKLLGKILDVVADEKTKKRPKCEDALVNGIFEVMTLPDEYVNAFTKDKLRTFYSAAYDLSKTHNMRMSLLRYTHLSVDKALIFEKFGKCGPAKQRAINKYVDELEALEKGNCEMFRTVYVNYLLKQVEKALQQGKPNASDIILHIQDKKIELCALKDCVQKAFMLGKLSCCCPIRIYFQFLSDRAARAPKRRAKGKTRGGGARKRVKKEK